MMRRGRAPLDIRPKRLPRHRQPVETILIVGEGKETEPNYFRGLRDDPRVRDRIRLIVKEGRGGSPEDVTRQAIKEKADAEDRQEAFEEVWCVWDLEGSNQFQSARTAIGLATANGVTPCASNPCFEVWFLSHFQRASRPFNDGDAVIRELNRYWQDHCGQRYRKSDADVYSRLSGLTSTAISNAREVLESDHQGRPCIEANSSTEVYRLVRRLLGQQKEAT
ncbi:MAG: RloB domain-containing protein [Planctomycetes bacterium]|nr:RloB domain-containing protein [Planctomycetota bacterium]